MKTIKFSEDELSFLRQLYTDELDSAERYIFQIREILKKLGGSFGPSILMLNENANKLTMGC